jgi:hypothetical protein
MDISLANLKSLRYKPPFSVAFTTRYCDMKVYIGNAYMQIMATQEMEGYMLAGLTSI